MEFKEYKADHNGFRFHIKEDLPEVGFYMFIYRPGEDVDFRDELQDSLEICKEIAFEDWGVPYEKWRIV